MDPNAVRTSAAGRSITERLMNDLVDMLGELAAEDPSETELRARLQGECHGVAWAIAVMRAPYDAATALPVVKAEARAIWKAKQ